MFLQMKILVGRDPQTENNWIHFTKSISTQRQKQGRYVSHASKVAW